ncbi:hypothetical protein V1638_12645 [Pseudarthrobacter sp. J64]|uniref:hypothetical protein n=1 Tax=Pseudarthrobacter sp. J64 TaxID=3116485 RepID=UPI002E814568|nr:hypothetical protein [Pseudarthrobacter sp. J64]MEE2570238.1 hypothetical protein [Pseudarthrobacter sp. J64]
MDTNRHRTNNPKADNSIAPPGGRIVAGLRPRRFYREFTALQAVPIEELVTLQFYLREASGPSATTSSLELLAAVDQELRSRTGSPSGPSGRTPNP